MINVKITSAVRFIINFEIEVNYKLKLNRILEILIKISLSILQGRKRLHGNVHLPL